MKVTTYYCKGDYKKALGQVKPMSKGVAKDQKCSVCGKPAEYFLIYEV
jgi:hypothetical protein